MSYRLLVNVESMSSSPDSSTSRSSDSEIDLEDDGKNSTDEDVIPLDDDGLNVLDTDFFLENIQSPFKIEFFPSKPRSRFEKIMCSINIGISTLFSLTVIGLVVFASLELERKLPTSIIVCYAAIIGVSLIGMGFSWYYTLKNKIWKIVFGGIVTATIDIVLVVATRFLR